MPKLSPELLLIPADGDQDHIDHLAASYFVRARQKLDALAQTDPQLFATVQATAAAAQAYAAVAHMLVNPELLQAARRFRASQEAKLEKKP